MENINNSIDLWEEKINEQTSVDKLNKGLVQLHWYNTDFKEEIKLIEKRIFILLSNK